MTYQGTIGRNRWANGSLSPKTKKRQTSRLATFTAREGTTAACTNCLETLKPGDRYQTEDGEPRHVSCDWKGEKNT